VRNCWKSFSEKRKTTIAGALELTLTLVLPLPQIFAIVVKIEKQKIHVCGSQSGRTEIKRRVE
jgi:hypothetical protein